MRKILVILTLMIAFSVTNAQTIQLKKEGDLYLIPCEVNGVKLDFYFDTGASLVSISLTEAKKLFETEKLSESDIIGKIKLTVADGKLMDGTMILLRNIKVGNLNLSNVEAVITESQTAPLLLGQSAIKKFGSFTFDYSSNKLTVNAKPNGSLSPVTIPKIREVMKEGLSEYELSRLEEFFKNKHQILNNIQVEIVRHEIKKNKTDNVISFTFDVTNNSDYDFSLSKQMYANPPKVINIVITVFTKDGKRYTSKTQLHDILSGDTYSAADGLIKVNIRNKEVEGYIVRVLDLDL